MTKRLNRLERIALQAEIDRLLKLTPFPSWTLRHMLLSGINPVAESLKTPIIPGHNRQAIDVTTPTPRKRGLVSSVTLDDGRDKVLEDSQRAWSRHPKLRTQYKSFQHYLTDIKHNVTFA